MSMTLKIIDSIKGFASKVNTELSKLLNNTIIAKKGKLTSDIKLFVQKQLLLPQSIQVPSSLSIHQSKVMTLLRNLKFELVLMGETQWWLRAMPAVIHETAVSILVPWIENQFLKAHTGKEFKESVLIKELACLAAPHRQNGC